MRGDEDGCLRVEINAHEFLLLLSSQEHREGGGIFTSGASRRNHIDKTVPGKPRSAVPNLFYETNSPFTPAFKYLTNRAPLSKTSLKENFYFLSLRACI